MKMENNLETIFFTTYFKIDKLKFVSHIYMDTYIHHFDVYHLKLATWMLWKNFAKEKVEGID